LGVWSPIIEYGDDIMESGGESVGSFLEGNYPSEVMEAEKRIAHCQANRKPSTVVNGLPFPGCVILSFSESSYIYWGEVVNELKKQHPEIVMEMLMLDIHY